MRLGKQTRRRSIVFGLASLLALAAVSGFVLKDELLRRGLEYKLSRQTGCHILIGKLRADFSRRRLVAENISVRGQRPGPDIYLRIPKLALVWAGQPWFGKTVHLAALDAQIESIDFVLGSNSETRNGAGVHAARSADSSTSAGADFPEIDRLQLTLGHVICRSPGGSGTFQKIDFQNETRSKQDVRSWTELESWIVDWALQRGIVIRKTFQSFPLEK